MAERGMYRWGSGWVDKANFDKLTDADAEIRKRLGAMEDDFAATQGRISRLESEITQSERTMKEMEGRSWTRTVDGTLIRLPLPQAYYDIQRDIVKLKAERQEQIAHLEALRDSARRAQNDLPVPRYTGVMHLIEEDGVPVILPEGVKEMPTHSTPPAPPPAAAPPPASQKYEPPIIRIGPSHEAE